MKLKIKEEEEVKQCKLIMSGDDVCFIVENSLIAFFDESEKRLKVNQHNLSELGFGTEVGYY